MDPRLRGGDETRNARESSPDRDRNARLIRLLGTIAEATASAATISDMLRVAVKEICRFLKWPVGHAFVPSQTPSQELVSAGIWHLDHPKRFASFRRASKHFPHIERGLIGRAVAAGKAIQVVDISDRAIEFVHLDEAKEAGLMSSIILPVMAGGRTIAVVEFYTTARTEPDAILLKALDQVAGHIGHVAERVETRSAQRQIADAIEGIDDGIALYDQDERLLLCNRRYAASMFTIGDILKPGLRLSEEVAALTERGHYIGVGKGWVKKRLRAFRALKPIESCQRGPDGQERWFASRHHRTREGCTILVRTDITERKRAEAERELAQQLLQTALDSMTDGVALYDKDERLVLYNENYLLPQNLPPGYLKPGLTYTEIVTALLKRGAYVGAGKDMVDRRVRQFRALEPSELHMIDQGKGECWLHVHLYRTRDGGTFLVRTDITKRKRAEAELESARQLLQTALDSMSDGAALFDKDERLVLWNEDYVGTRPQLHDFIKPGLTFAEIVGHLMKQGGYANAGNDWVKTRLRQFRALESTELHLRDPGGGERWAYVHHYRTRDGGTFLIRTDITARKRAEQELASAKQLLQTALDSMTDGVALFDQDERLVLWNEGFVATSPGLRKTVKPGIAFTDMVAQMTAEGRYIGSGKDWVETRLRRFRALESTEVHVRDPAGNERWAFLQHYRTRDGGTFLVRTDITERKRAEMELASARQLLQTALDSMNDGIALYDQDERLVLWNENYTRNFPALRGIVKLGITFPEIVATLSARQSYLGKGEDFVATRLGKFRALETAELHVRDSKGDHWLVVRHYRTRDGGTLLVLTEITDRVMAMGEVERARAAAEAANAAKTKFLASMSHELRTPLNAILGFAQMLEIGTGRITEAVNREYLAIILKSGQHLLDLVDQILELSMVETQQVEMRIQALSPAQKARECVDMVREEAKRREVEIVDLSGAGGPDVRFLGDPVRVRQVLLNLLSNAVKYNSPGGRVTMSCAPNGDGRIRFAVADTGLGIPPDRRDEVFQPFSRLGREAGNIEGSGIGLALSRQLVERMGGSIGFESEPGQGSTFWFELPEAGAENEAEERA